MTYQDVMDLLEDIDEENFIEKTTDSKSKCCAAGHINRLLSSNPNDYSYKNCTAFDENKPAYPFVMEGLTKANDAFFLEYKEYPIKERVMKWLNKKNTEL